MMRMVFNAQSEFDGLSLTKMLLTVPDLLKGFRNHLVTIAADMEVMQNQMKHLHHVSG